jgi:hypothetical protein
MAKRQSKSKPQKPKANPRLRGPYGLSIPAAGALIGLGRNASYEAAKAGKIPTLDLGGNLKIVPRLTWLRTIGASEDAA